MMNYEMKIETFSKLLLEYNKIHNISGIKNLKDIQTNIEDAVYPIQFLKDIKSAIDIGTGAGFPGLILAMAMENTHFTLVEPILKRTAFLHLVKSSCDLQNVTIVSDRIENIKPFKADLITSRAVADTKMLINLAKSFIQKETLLLFYKGENVKNEISDEYDYEIIQRNKRRYLFIKGIK